jgi:hypothetical protein
VPSGHQWFVCGWGLCNDAAVPEEVLVEAARAATPVAQVVELTRWVGAGRKLTQTGRLTMNDARALVELLKTGDEIDPKIGDRVFRTRSSEDLCELTLIVLWAREVGLLRVVQGRLVPVKKNAALLDRPLQLWTAMFDAFGKLGEAVCPPGWGRSMFGDGFSEGLRILLTGLAYGGGALDVEAAYELIWNRLVWRYRTEHLTEEQLRTWRRVTERDVRLTGALLGQLGAIINADGTMRLTALAQRALRRGFDPLPGVPIVQLHIELAEATPAIWRRVQVPASVTLRQLHAVVQAAMGWTDSHLHMFTHRATRYGHSEPELMLTDDTTTTLRDLAVGDGETLAYEYDFGDSWDHTIRIEKILDTDPDVRYPVCLDGERICPPEDCGGTWGYQELLETLADPEHEEHDHMRSWLGLEPGHDFDPDHFDLDEANRRLWAASLGAYAS